MKNSLCFLAAWAVLVCGTGLASDEPAKKDTETAVTPLKIGDKAPAFKVKDSGGKVIDLAELTKKGPVLVRLTCGCSGCDKELAYFQELHEAYKSKGLTSLAIFKEQDTKVEEYVKSKKLNMLYAVDTKGESWDTFQTKTMPTNFLIDKGGKIVAIANGCDTTGLLAKKLSEKVADVTKSPAVDVKAAVDAKRQSQADEKR